MLGGALFSVFGVLAGCSGGGCEVDLPIEVSVSDPNGAVISDATVFISPDGEPETEIPCPSNGDGTYACTAPETGEYKLYVEPVIGSGAGPYYETYGTTLIVEPFEDCDVPMTHTAVLRFESGGA